VNFLRLRQVCLVSRELERDAARIESQLGLAECHRDPNVAKYGLENVLFPVGTSFIEIVAPTREGTAAGRFLDRHGGRYGYMVILDCDDPERREKHAQSLGIRIANLIRHGSYLGVQLHPKDTGAAMIEFNRTEGGADPMGPYAPAGPHWQRAIRDTMARRLLAVEIECPDPGALAAKWSAILERPVRDGRIDLDAGSIRFLPSAVPEAVFAGVELEAAAPASAEICGVRFRLVTGT
jgi:hypothetical protein